MHTALMVILAIVSVFLIISVLLQSGNSDGLSGSIAGGAEQLFGKMICAALSWFLSSWLVLEGLHLLCCRLY